jgi:hypothetical protein
MVLDFTGELHVPLEVCGAVVKRELNYWQITESHIKSCCWRNYRTYIENQRILEAFNHSVLLNQKILVDPNSLQGWEKYRTKMWLILEYPRTSKPAFVRVFNVILLCFRPFEWITNNLMPGQTHTGFPKGVVLNCPVMLPYSWLYLQTSFYVILSKTGTQNIFSIFLWF